MGRASKLSAPGPFRSPRAPRKVFAERLLRARALAARAAGADAARVKLPLYVMTSPLNDARTRAFFRAHRRFGLDAADVVFFEQGTLPALSLGASGGKLLMEDGGRVDRRARAATADGSGTKLRPPSLSLSLSLRAGA